MLATTAANEALPWNAEAWLSAFDQALDAEDGDQQDALALLAKQAMEDAQRRGDVDREHSIRAAASKARQAREDAAEEAQTRQSTVPNIEVPFGTGALPLPLPPQLQVTTAKTSNTLATTPKRGIDNESREILKY
ncbi:hypothetical protein HUS91_34155, partial [Pseudomonas chlororaphis]